MVGGMCGRGVHDRGRNGTGGGVHGRRDGHCNRRYASYWNAFLLYYDSVISLGIKVSVGDATKCKNVQLVSETNFVPAVSMKVKNPSTTPEKMNRANTV